MNIKKIRKWHLNIALITVIPLLIICCSGILLSLRNFIPLIQMQPKKGHSGLPLIAVEQVIEKVKSIPEAQVRSVEDIKSIEIRPALGTYNIRSKNGYEIQMDFANGDILAASQRWTGILNDIHEGVYFANWVKMGIFIPTGFAFLMLLFTGLILLLRIRKS